MPARSSRHTSRLKQRGQRHNVDGRMIESLHVRNAERILALADLIAEMESASSEMAQKPILLAAFRALSWCNIASSNTGRYADKGAEAMAAQRRKGRFMAQR